MNTKKHLSKTLQNMLKSSLGVLVFCCFLLLAHTTQAAVTCPTTGTWTTVGGVCFPTDTGLSDKPAANIIKNVMNWMLGVLGFIGVLGFVISGVQYLMSAGDEGTIDTAKRNMKYSIIGVIVALSGYVVISAINNLLNVSATPF